MHQPTRKTEPAVGLPATQEWGGHLSLLNIGGLVAGGGLIAVFFEMGSGNFRNMEQLLFIQPTAFTHPG